MKIVNMLFFIFLILGTIQARADITSNLQGEWKFAEGSGTTANDTSGNGNAGTLSSPAPIWVTGVSGVSSNALSFNGSNNDVSIPSSTSINTVATANQMTVSAWIKVASLPNNYQIIVENGTWGLLLNNNNEISMMTSGASSEYNNGFSFTADNQWHLITGTFNGTTGTISLYEDGIFKKSYTGGALSSSVSTVTIGAANWQGQYFSGSIDDVRIYSRALSSNDVILLYGKTPVSLTTDETTYATAPATVQLTATAYPASNVTVSNVGFYENPCPDNVCPSSGLGTLIGTGTSGTNNTYTFSWSDVATGEYSLTAVVNDNTTSGTNTSAPVYVYVNISQLLYTVNEYGLQSLVYNGQQFVARPVNGGIGGVLFQNLGTGAQKLYGWINSANGGENSGSNSAGSAYTGISATPNLSSTSNTYYTGSACSGVGQTGSYMLPSNWATVSPGIDPVCTQNVYPGQGTGGSDGYTVSTLYTTADPKTLKIDYYVTDNDSTDTLEQFNMGEYMEFTTPAIIQGGFMSMGSYVNSSPMAFASGTWGSMALFTDNYGNSPTVGNIVPANNTQYGDVWSIALPITKMTFEQAFSNPPNGDPEPSYGDAVFNWLQANNYLDIYGYLIANLTSQTVLNALQAQFTDPAETIGGQTEYQTILGILQGAPAYPLDYLWGLQNFSSPGGDPGNAKNDPIGPGQTYHYALYVRFGLPTDTPATLASPVVYPSNPDNPVPVAFSAFAQSYPLLVNWPDRRPIARWMMTGPQYQSNANPREWNLDDLDITSQANFSASVLSRTNAIINMMNNENPKPQGMVIWDLEGQEMSQPFTYVGNPPQLSVMAPEMDAVADQMFAAFKAAGYQVGMTLRPSNFQTGNTLPATCNDPEYVNGVLQQNPSPAAGWTWLSDIFVLTTPPTVAVNSMGTGYKVGDQLNFAETPLGSYAGKSLTRSGAIVTVSAVNSSGGITGLALTGTWDYAYTTATNLPVTYVSGSGTGSGATINFTSTSTYPNRAYVCTAPNTWTQPGAQLPNTQTVSDIDSTTLSWLETKVAYAHKRWGARLFYVDSTVYAGGAAFNFNIFRQLQQAFPDCVFFPENVNSSFYGGSSPYAGYEVSSAQLIWPQSFSILPNMNGTPTDGYPAAEQLLQNGNIFFYEGAWYEPDTVDEQLYQDAAQLYPNVASSNALNSYGLTVVSTGSGSGNVTGTISMASAATNNQPINIQEINCPSANCVSAFEGGTTVTLTEVPASGSAFSGWTVTGSSAGTCVGTTSSCTITMTATTSVTANFAPPTNVQLGDVNGDGQVTIYDAELTAQKAIGLPVANFNVTSAEVDGNSNVDIYDAFLIAEYAIGSITKFPVQGGS